MSFITRLHDRFFAIPLVARFDTVVRYLIAGGIAAGTDLGFLYVFTDVLGIWYLLSAVLAFLIAFVVSFVLQKFWTFGDKNTDVWKSQAALYFIVTSTNLGLNTLLMYLFVDQFGIHYLLSQIIISAGIACESFFVYQIFIFRKNHGAR